MIKAKGNFEEVCLLQFIACVRITIGKVIPIYATQKLQHMPQCGENDSHILSKKRYQIYRLKCLLFHFLKTNESERHKEWLSVYYELISFAVLCYQLYTIKWFSTISMTLILSSSIHIKWEENRLSLQIRTNTNIVIITSIIIYREKSCHDICWIQAIVRTYLSFTLIKRTKLANEFIRMNILFPSFVAFLFGKY